MPKKSKVTQNQSEAASGISNGLAPDAVEKRVARRRSPSTKKPVSTTRKTATGEPLGTKKPKASPPLEPGDAEIRLRAYFISERRHRLGLPGDSNSDWLEAKRQLLSEVGPR